MSRWWDRAAGTLQRNVRQDEWGAGEEPTEEEARRANVHAREDLILVVSLLSSLNRQLETIKVGVLLLLALAVWAVWLK